MRSRRLLTAAVALLVLTNLATAGVFLYSSRTSATRPFINPFPLIDPARSFSAQDNFVTNIQPLREEINAMVAQFNGPVSLYLEYLNTGANISINPDLYLWPASLAKVPLAMAVMKKVEDGEWNLDNELVLMAGDRNEESGDGEKPLYEYPVGTRFTIRTLLQELLVNSDNTAFYILLRNVDADEMGRIVEDLGLEQLFTEEGRVSAKEYSRMMRALYVSSFLNREHSQMILGWLDQSPFNDFLAAPVPPGVPFPHKYGQKININVYTDSGIVYLPDRPYLLTVIVQGDESAPFETEIVRSAEFMQEVSRAAYEYFSKN